MKRLVSIAVIAVLILLVQSPLVWAQSIEQIGQSLAKVMDDLAGLMEEQQRSKEARAQGEVLTDIHEGALTELSDLYNYLWQVEEELYYPSYFISESDVAPTFMLAENAFGVKCIIIGFEDGCNIDSDRSLLYILERLEVTLVLVKDSDTRSAYLASTLLDGFVPQSRPNSIKPIKKIDTARGFAEEVVAASNTMLDESVGGGGLYRLALDRFVESLPALLESVQRVREHVGMILLTQIRYTQP